MTIAAGVATVFLAVVMCFGALACSRTTRPKTQAIHPIHGLNFSPYLAGQDPAGTVLGEEQVRSRLAICAQYCRWVRTFGCTGGLEVVPALAHAMNLRVAAGAWLGSDEASNQREIAALISAAQQGTVDIAIVGSETLLRNDLSLGSLLEYIEQVRAAIADSIPITSVQLWRDWARSPSLVSACDVLMMNDYPYWDGVSIDCAIASLDHHYRIIVALAGGKPVLLSETGWPSCGNTVGLAVPSPENAARYFGQFVRWTAGYAISAFYFEAFDEAWKIRDEGPQGACWGLWDQDGVLKSGASVVFGGHLPSAVSTGGVINGPGTPVLAIMHLPTRGSQDNLEGRVEHVDPLDYEVAVYIYVNGWWTKPYWANPTTDVQCDGRWTCDITTGGNDSQATRIAAFLLPDGYDPPLAYGDAALSSDLAAHAVASVEVTRSAQ